MSFVYFSKSLNSLVPCEIVPNKIKTVNNGFCRDYYCAVTYDIVAVNDFSLSMNQIKKYCNDYINIHDLYPMEQMLYSTDLNVVVSKELTRYSKVYEALSNVESIDSDILYHLCILFVSDIQFKYLTHSERLFMKSLSDEKLIQAPVTVLTLPSLKMLIRLFDRFQGDLSVIYRVQNVQSLHSFDYVFPLDLSISNIKFNLSLIRFERPELF